jgi:hypothetical protein
MRESRVLDQLSTGVRLPLDGCIERTGFVRQATH